MGEFRREAWPGGPRVHNLPFGLGSSPRIRKVPFGIGSGLRFLIDMEFSKRFYFGLYEIELNKYLRAFCRRGYNCFDVGGQWGWDALVLAKLTGGRVVSFESEPDNCLIMNEVFAANVRLERPPESRHGFVGAVHRPDEGLLSIDGFAYSQEGFVPDVVKIDIEGGEAEALSGAERVLQERKPHMVIEIHSKELELDCRSRLEAAGYEPHQVRPRKWLKDFRLMEFNGWLVAKGSDST